MEAGIIPHIKWMIKEGFWEMHEAVFNLTSWPKDQNIVAMGTPLAIKERFKRGIIYGPQNRLQNRRLTPSSRQMLIAIEESLSNGELIGYPTGLFLKKSYGHSVSYLLKTDEVIIWALRKGFIISEDVQGLIGLSLLNDPINSKRMGPHLRKVQNQTVSQYILKSHPEIRKMDVKKHQENFIYEHTLMQKFGDIKVYQDNELKAIRRHIKEMLNMHYEHDLNVLSSAIQRKSDGIPSYHIPSFERIIKTLIKIRIGTFARPDLFKMTELDFLQEISKDEVIQLYMQQAPKVVCHLLAKFYNEEITKFFSHPRILEMPFEKRQDKTIGELWRLNKEYCTMLFTSEEKELFLKGVDDCL